MFSCTFLPTCARSETAGDVGATLTSSSVRSLPTHPLEHHLIPTDPDQSTHNDTQHGDNNNTNSIAKFLHLIEVYINDFIQLNQTTNPAQLLHLSCALLNAIHSAFPPPSVTGGTKEDPIALQKLLLGDSLWAMCKELLGWIFNGVK